MKTVIHQSGCGTVKGERLPLFELNPSVKAEDEERLSNQAQVIYRLLQRGRVRNDKLAEIAFQYNARIWEIRRYLESQGKTVKMIPGENGLNWYEIQELKNGKE